MEDFKVTRCRLISLQVNKMQDTYIRYLAFKRAVWLAETLFLLCIIIALNSWGSHPEILLVSLVIQFTRVVASAWNHWHLADLFHMPDAMTLA